MTAATHRDEPTFDPAAYWWGPAWPQLTYLLRVAARRRGDDVTAAGLGERLIASATRSGLSEFWHPDTGGGLGAVPPSWTVLAAVVAGQALRAQRRTGALCRRLSIGWMRSGQRGFKGWEIIPAGRPAA